MRVVKIYKHGRGQEEKPPKGMAVKRKWQYLAAKVLLKLLAPPIPFLKTHHYSAIIYKADGIGDFVLASSFIRILLDHYGPTQCCLIVNDLVLPLAQKEFPKTPIMNIPNVRHRSLRGILPFLIKYKWKISTIQGNVVISPRYMRDNYDNLYLALIRGQKSIGVEVNPDHPLRRSMPKFPLFTFSEGIAIGKEDYPLPSMNEETCLDLRVHRHYLSHILNKDLSELEVRPSLENIPIDNDGYISITPYGGDPIRDFPESHLIEVIKKVKEKFDVPVYLTGSKDQGPSLELLRNRMLKENTAGVFAKWDLSLDEFVQFIARARAVITVDTSTAHIASALDKPMVSLVGGGHFGLFAPWQSSRKQIWLNYPMPCYHCSWQCTQPEPFCITRISPEKIVESFYKLMRETTP